MSDLRQTLAEFEAMKPLVEKGIELMRATLGGQEVVAVLAALRAGTPVVRHGASAVTITFPTAEAAAEFVAADARLR